MRRPNLGCRTLVQRELSKYLSGIVNELNDWLDDVRVKSAQLLCITVQHAERHITQHLEKILPAMRKSCSDNDKRVRDNVSYTLCFENVVRHIADDPEEYSYLTDRFFFIINLYYYLDCKYPQLADELENSIFLLKHNCISVSETFSIYTN